MIKRINLLIIIGSIFCLPFQLSASAHAEELVGASVSADVVAKQYARGIVDYEPGRIAHLVDKDLVRNLESSGMTPEDYIYSYLNNSKKLGNIVTDIEVFKSVAKAHPAGLIYLAPWKRKISTPIGSYEDEGRYLLVSYDKGKSWGVVDNSCFIPGMLKAKFAEIEAADQITKAALK